jgi:hypothetical protein
MADTAVMHLLAACGEGPQRAEAIPSYNISPPSFLPEVKDEVSGTHL